jgi:hypothetical protein
LIKGANKKEEEGKGKVKKENGRAGDGKEEQRREHHTQT